jgi:citrate synthase
MPTHLSAAEAAAELGVSVPTLYAYVSRGLVRSEATDNSRRRLYLAEDVWLLKERKDHRRDPARAAQEALHWGLPALESRLSVIHAGRLYYRGRDVVTLATTCTLEQVAALLWEGDLATPLPDDFMHPLPEAWTAVSRVAAALPPLEGFQLLLPLAAAHDSLAYDLRGPAVARTGARILRLLTAVAAGAKPSRRPVAEVLQRHWAPKNPDAARLLQAALVLYADNGLNPSSFTARCVASAGSTPYALVTAGLAALQGSKHGGACERAEAVLQEARDPRGVRHAVVTRLRRGETVPGFGHPLYPDGDPRGALLMKMVAELPRRSPDVAVALELAAAVRELMSQHPTVDFGVLTVCRALDLPAGAPLALLAIGRVVGWIGHGLEQYREGRVIRPRARYAGDLPQSIEARAQGTDI